MNKTKSVVVALIVWLLAGVVMLVYGMLLPKTDNGEKRVTLAIEYANKKYEYKDLTTSEEYVFGLLKQYNEHLELGLEYNESIYGAYITSLKGTPQNDDIGIYYLYDVNGERANNGISTQPLKNNDVIRIFYAKTEYDQSFNEISTTLQNGGNDTIINTPMNDNAKTYIIIGILCVVVGVGSVVITILKRRANE